MYTATAVAAALLPLIGSTVAAPPAVADIRRSNLMTRQDDATQQGQIYWENPDGGNLQIFYSDEKVNFGQMNPVDIIRSNLSVTCTTYGVCIAGAVDVGSSMYVSSPGIESLDISYEAFGQYPSWVHNGMIDLIAGVLEKQIEVHNECYTPAATGCGTFMAYCPQSFDPVCADEFTAPTKIGAVLVGDQWDTQTPGALQVVFTVTQEGLGGLCSTLTTVGGTLVGQIPEIGGAASGIFSLAALGCAD